MNIAIIPARKNSKRIKNKNIKSFFGKPVISYAIKCALKSKLFDKVIVSTDSKKIIKIAKKYEFYIKNLQKILLIQLEKVIDFIQHMQNLYHQEV